MDDLLGNLALDSYRLLAGPLWCAIMAFNCRSNGHYESEGPRASYKLLCEFVFELGSEVGVNFQVII